MTDTALACLLKSLDPQRVVSPTLETVANTQLNVVLTGFMATGKSSVGRELAARQSLKFVDTDQLIVDQHGSIEQIFASKGEDAFREMERAVAKDLQVSEGLVIATGGRMMLDDYCASALTSNAHVFCLAASVEEIQRRYYSDQTGAARPLLADKDETKLRELYEERSSAYSQFLQVQTDGKSIAEVVEEIEMLLRSM